LPLYRIGFFVQSLTTDKDPRKELDPLRDTVRGRVEELSLVRGGNFHLWGKEITL